MIEQIDNLLTKEECNQIIDYGKSLDMDIYDKGRYYYSNIMRRNTLMEDAFSPPVLQPAYHALVKLKKSYIKSFPEVNNLDPETIYFITNLLNKLNLTEFRNEILSTALPLRI